MKAYLDFLGFSKMINITRPYPEIKIPLYEVTDIYYEPKNVMDDVELHEITFYRVGELTGGDEVILKYSTHGLAQWWKEQIIKGENDGNI